MPLLQPGEHGIVCAIAVPERLLVSTRYVEGKPASLLGCIRWQVSRSDQIQCRPPSSRLSGGTAKWPSLATLHAPTRKQTEEALALSPVPLSAVEVSKQYRRGVRALAEVSLEIPMASVTGLVGPNGAGKSTLLKLWLGFDRPTGGRVRVNGLDPWVDREQALSYLGYVPQDVTLYRSLSIADHLILAHHLRPRLDQAEAARYLNAFGVRMTARPTALSGGEQTQVALALALASNGETLLLDEPLSNLDPLARSEVLDQIRIVARGRGKTVLLSSHIVSDIESICDHLIVLGVGEVLLQGRIGDLLSSHAVTTRSDIDRLKGVVATVQQGAGPRLTLFRADVAQQYQLHADAFRMASLEELVKGYLALGRSGTRS